VLAAFENAGYLQSVSRPIEELEADYRLADQHLQLPEISPVANVELAASPHSAKRL
jgi:hypothetical protein